MNKLRNNTHSLLLQIAVPFQRTHRYVINDMYTHGSMLNQGYNRLSPFPFKLTPSIVLCMLQASWKPDISGKKPNIFSHFRKWQCHSGLSRNVEKCGSFLNYFSQMPESVVRHFVTHRFTYFYIVKTRPKHVYVLHHIEMNLYIYIYVTHQQTSRSTKHNAENKHPFAKLTNS